MSGLFITLLIPVLLPFSFGSVPSGVPSSIEGRGSLNIVVRDSLDGRRVRAAVRAESLDGTSALRSTSGSGELAVAGRGRTAITLTAEGYRAISSYFILDGSDLPVTIYMDPVEPPAELRPENVESRMREGKSLLQGHVYDENGKPVAGAQITVSGRTSAAGPASVITNAAGYFDLTISNKPIDPLTGLPGSAQLAVELDGKTIYERRGFLVPDGATHFIIDVDLSRPISIDARHKFSFDPAEGEIYEPPISPELAPMTRPLEPGAVTVPQSIRVGSNCLNGRTSCTVFTVYSLDTYVRFGLDDEWIASWNANSLKAGAIAFRSYGVYHVFFPINAANYDICNTTSCQVCDPSDSATSTNNATAQTTGSIVVNAAGTGPFFSEYSAENNLGGCPDGFTGNNGTWPCLADPVDMGQAFFGHGRGMCQWGSQRWSVNQGKDFVWIVNHYYNALGNPSGLRNGWLQMGPDTLLPPPDLAQPGTQTAPGTPITTLTPTFEWQARPGADGYGLYVSRFNGTSYELVFNSETSLGAPVTGNSFTLPLGVLQAGNDYRWNMSSHIPAGYGTPNTFRNYFSVASRFTVSGRVTTPAGLGLRNAVVALTDSDGTRMTATTSSFGLYSFGDLVPGQTYTLSVSSKRYRFAPQTLHINSSLSDVDLTGLE